MFKFNLYLTCVNLGSVYSNSNKNCEKKVAALSAHSYILFELLPAFPCHALRPYGLTLA